VRFCVLVVDAGIFSERKHGVSAQLPYQTTGDAGGSKTLDSSMQPIIGYHYSSDSRASRPTAAVVASRDTDYQQQFDHTTIDREVVRILIFLSSVCLFACLFKAQGSQFRNVICKKKEYVWNGYLFIKYLCSYFCIYFCSYFIYLLLFKCLSCSVAYGWNIEPRKFGSGMVTMWTWKLGTCRLRKLSWKIGPLAKH